MRENKTAFIAIVGRPNVGKSSILNKLLGQKIAIVSDKPQTTRTRIMGVLTIEETQLVFTDTPGFHRPKTKLGEKMVKAVSDSISGVDFCLFVIESEGELRETELELIEKFKQQKMPVVLAINKIDTLSDKTVLMKRIMDMTQLYDFEAIVPVSAVKNDGLDALTDELIKLAQPSEHFLPGGFSFITVVGSLSVFKIITYAAAFYKSIPELFLVHTVTSPKRYLQRAVL